MVTRLQLGDIAVDVVLKDIKNIHLSVNPPAGRVRISAPRWVPSGKWLEFEGGVISGLFNQPGPALSRRRRSRHDDG